MKKDEVAKKMNPRGFISRDDYDYKKAYVPKKPQYKKMTAKKASQKFGKHP